MDTSKSNRAAQNRKTRESRPDIAMLYIQKQVEAQTPMVFVTRDAEIHATVLEFGKYEHLLNVDGEPTPVKKATLQYHYKAIDADTVAEKIGAEDAALTNNDHRSRVSNRLLWASRSMEIPARFTLRGGDTFTGLVEWFTPYAVKLNIGMRGADDTASVVLHRRAALWAELLEEYPANQDT